MAKRIFIADNKPATVGVLEQKLSALGYETLATSDGKEVLRIINVNNLPDLILLDANLKEETCLSICQELKREKRTRDVQILILKEKNVDAGPYREIGIQQFVERPCDINDLLNKINNLLQSGPGKRSGQPQSKLSVTTILGVIVVILCVLAMLFLVFIPLLTAKK